MAEVSPKKEVAEPTPADAAVASVDVAEPAEPVTPDLPAVSNPDDELLKDLDQFVESVMPDEKLIEAMKAIRKQARAMMETVIRNSPDVPRRKEALRHIQVSMLFTITAMLMPKMQFEKSKEESNA